MKTYSALIVIVLALLVFIADSEARWYEPQMGRFLSEDPIGLAGGINKYSYVGNSPLNFRDPLGLIWQTVGHEDPILRNYFNMLRNRYTYEPLDGTLQEIHGAEGVKRWVIQRWVHDPKDPERDKEYCYGTIRKVPQYKTKYVRYQGEVSIHSGKYGAFYIRWSPQILKWTYENYPNIIYIYPPVIRQAR
jgi:uncharacterized protein RhaS with RHS repeats